MKNALEWINSWFSDTEECISDMEDWILRITQYKWQKVDNNNNKQYNEDTLRYFWSNIRYANIHIIRVPEGEEKQAEKEQISRIRMKRESQTKNIP